MSTDTYTTHDGDEVPEQAAAAFDSPSEWPEHNRVAPDSVPVLSTQCDTLYEGFVDGERRCVNDRGDVCYPDEFEHTHHITHGQVPSFEYDTAVTYNDDIDHADPDMMTDPESYVIVHGQHGEIWVGNTGEVLFSHHVDQEGEVTAEMVTLAVAVLAVDSGVDIPAEISRTVSGWHSTFEPSDQSEMVNALNSGDLPPKIDSEESYPYAVKTTNDTKNVCSVSKAIYGTETFNETMREYFDQSNPRPIGSGLKSTPLGGQVP